MIYAIVFLAAYLVFSIPCMFKYFRQESRIHELEDSVHQNNKTIHDLNAAIERLQAEKKERPLPAPAVRPSADYEALNRKYKASLLELELMSNKLAKLEHTLTHDLRQYSWGDLFKGSPFPTFDPEWLKLEEIHFPTFNPNKVYYAPKSGRHFHAVSWCYCLDHADSIDSMSYRDLLHRSYKPCPVCCQREQLAKVAVS